MTSDPRLGAAPLLALASKWEAKANDCEDRFNELTYGNRSVGEMNGTINSLRQHAKELRQAINEARANAPGERPPKTER